ncbi:MAG: hypothetical protein DWQ37_17865 [Planctomycetota bacterium]|nr:MAG: hypothetical protein DWQ37_17865 [Planctomycetota bacterium]
MPALAELPLVVREDFENGADRWKPTVPESWKIVETPEGHVFNLHRDSKYRPPYRSPLNIAILEDAIVGDFTLTLRVQSTVKDYGHRSMVVVFGYQDPAHFYYVHFGKKTDDHANQIFIVDSAPRVKISTKTTPGTNWDDAWHEVKIVRTVDDGKIDVYFDDFETPVMTAVDKSFTWGQIGIGAFDDLGNFDDIELRGTVVKPTARPAAQ